MDRRLLGYYNRELQYIREMGAEFAREYPKIAGRLALDDFDCADPYVERLLEGFAFLTARVQLKLDAEFPRFTQAILETVCPNYLAPTPSMLVAQFEVNSQDSDLAEGISVPRGTVLNSHLGRSAQTPCEYRTSQEVTLWPIEVTEVEYHTRDLYAHSIPQDTGARAGLRVRLRCGAGLTFAKLPMNELVLHLCGPDEIPSRMYEQIFAHGLSVLAQPVKRPIAWQRTMHVDHILPMGFRSEEALLPVDPRVFEGYRLLQEYFNFPDRFMFVRVVELQELIGGAETDEIDLFFLTDEADLELRGIMSPENVRLHCTPAINLFPKRCDRVILDDQYSEYQVMPDRTRPLDFEIYQIRSVEGISTGGRLPQLFRPFYAAGDFDDGLESAYYQTNRVPRSLSERERRGARRSSYIGSEVYLTLVDAQAAPYHPDLSQLSVTAWCTNRDLPIQMPVGMEGGDFSPANTLPAEAIHCISGPTSPRASHTFGDAAWRLISHMSLNYLSLVNNDEVQGAKALRDLLKLYGDVNDRGLQNQIEGVLSIRSSPIIRRVGSGGPIAFARGLEVEITFDENSFNGIGCFLLGSVLETFFARYVTVNSFTETVLKTSQRGEIMRWPARLGKRELL